MKPLSIAPPSPIPTGLARTTWEQRRRMTVKEIIHHMGASHVNHPDFKQKNAPSLIRMENLAGRQPIFTATDPGFCALIKQLIRWGAQ